MQSSELSRDLYDIGAIKFGEFKLKSGKTSPYYVDFRILPSFPDVLSKAGKALAQLIAASGIQPTVLCGIPSAGLAIATACGLETKIPVIYTRKEPSIYKDLAAQLKESVEKGLFSNQEIAGVKKTIDYIENLSGFKTHGITRYVDGCLRDGDKCIIVDDLITTADSKLEARDLLLLEAKRNNIKIDVIGVFVILDRQQGGRQTLEKNGLRLFSALTIMDAVKELCNQGTLDQTKCKMISDYTISESR